MPDEIIGGVGSPVDRTRATDGDGVMLGRALVYAGFLLIGLILILIGR